MSKVRTSKLDIIKKIEHPFEPVCDSKAKILIVGTMASPKSRENGFYYTHPQNRFWKVLSLVLGQEIPLDIEGKKAFLRANHIALWDVLASCEIRNADDASITSPIANDMSVIFDRGKIRAVFATGKKAESLYRKYCLQDNEEIELHYLPSTSPANQGNYSLDDLVEHYKVILPYLK